MFASPEIRLPRNPLLDATNWAIVQALADGHTIPEICEAVRLSKGTVNRRLSALRKRLEARTNEHLIALALKQRLIS